jgi:hypothetical protein
MRNQGQKASPQDWEDWARNQVPQEFREKLAATREDAKESWATGRYAADNPAETLQLTTVALAGVEMLRQVIELIDEILQKE